MRWSFASSVISSTGETTMKKQQLEFFPDPPRPSRPVLPIGSVVKVAGVPARTRSAPIPLPTHPVTWGVLLEAREGIWPLSELST